MNAARRHRQEGFVLVVVLAMLVILSILAASVGAVAARLRDEQLQRQRQLAAEIDMASTEATVLYMLASQRMTFGGLTVDERMVLSEDERLALRSGETPLSYAPVGNEIAMDGTVYRGIGNTRFALQDDRGLLALNWAPEAMIARYLDEGRELPRPMSAMTDLLRDYQDSDDLHRLNGAERDTYEHEGLELPANRALSTPLELRRVLGWNKALGDVTDADLLDSISTVRSAQLNVNTAPVRVLRALPGVDETMAQRVVDARAGHPIVNLSAFYQLLGAVPVSEDFLSLYPMGSGTLKVWSPGGGVLRLLHWTLTPRDDGGRPWREDYEFGIPNTKVESDARRVEAKVFADPDVASPG